MARPAFYPVVPGTTFTVAGRLVRIEHVLGADSVLARDLGAGTSDRYQIQQLEVLEAEVVGEAPPQAVPALETFDPAEVEQAEQRLIIIRPLLKDPHRTRAKVEAAAKTAGLSANTLYEWISSFEDSGHLASLIPRRRGTKPGTRRLKQDIEKIISFAITDFYLKAQRGTAAQVIEAVDIACRNAKLPKPHPNTVRNRIRAIPAVSRLRARGMDDEARKYYPIRGHSPQGQGPLSEVQMDHTLDDVTIVDDHLRLPIGRPWLTVALDLYSRMVAGMVASLERPSAYTACYCIAQAMLTKKALLADAGVPGDWLVWGKIGTVQCDNAREFKGERLRAALKQYDVGLQLRPLKQPQYGAYIERFMGIRAQQTHRIPGTTFASIDERGTYDSERAATMTLREYRAYILDWTVNIYHQKPHSALKMPPSRRYELGIMGDNDHPGTGSITLPGSPEEIRLNFLPFEWRQVGRHGIRFMDMDFFHEVLIPWIDAEDVEDKRRKRRFLVRFDYEDITTKIWFWDPHLEQYFEIPNRRLMRPASQWEVKLALRLMKEDGGRHTDIDRIHAAMQRLDRRIEEAQGKTRHARKLAQRKLDAERVAKNRKPAADQSSGKTLSVAVLPVQAPKPDQAVLDDIDDDTATPITWLPVRRKTQED